MDWNKTLNSIFFTKPEDWIVQLGVAVDFPKVRKRMFDNDVHDFVPTKTFFADFGFFGYCAEIDLSNIKKYLIFKGDISADEFGPSDFSVVVWLKVIHIKKFKD